MKKSVFLVNTEDLNMVRQISELLTDTTDKFRSSLNGHVPDNIVTEIIHRHYTSVESISSSFSKTGYRFVLLDETTGSLIGTALIAKTPETIFVVDSSNMNVNRKLFPNVCPVGYHHMFNFAIKDEYRKRGLGKFFINSIIDEYRNLFSGKGLWVRSDPPLHDIYQKLGFTHITEYDSFLPENSSMPKNFTSLDEFNKRYICKCKRPKSQIDLSERCRYKYGVFTLDF